MNFSIILNTDDFSVSKIAEEAESNESLFIKELCTYILKQIAKETELVEKNLIEINLENPYGIIRGDLKWKSLVTICM